MAYLGMCTMDLVEYVNPLTGETTYGSSSCPPEGFVRVGEVDAKKQGFPDYPDQYFTSPGEPVTCDDYCATMKSGSAAMRYLASPEGCTCPGLYKPTPMTLPAPLPSPGKIQLTPQQIEAQVKQIQPAATGGGLALAAIAAFLILGA